MSHLHRNLLFPSNSLFRLESLQLTDYALFCLLNENIEMSTVEFSQHKNSSDTINKYLFIRLNHWPMLKCYRTSNFPISDGTRPNKLLPPMTKFIKILCEMWWCHRPYIIMNSWWLDTHWDPIPIPHSSIQFPWEWHHLACY